MNYKTQYIITSYYCDVTVITKQIYFLSSKFAKTWLTSINIDHNQSTAKLSGWFYQKNMVDLAPHFEFVTVMLTEQLTCGIDRT